MIKRPAVVNIDDEDNTKNSIESEKAYAKLDSKGNIKRLYVKDFQYTALGMVILNRMLRNRDIKIVITSSGSTTGTGKSTLGIILSRVIEKYNAEIFGRESEWTAQESAFTSGWEYVDKYKSADPGEPLITDELEIMLDSRRSMTDRNLEVTQRFQTMRYRNVVTVATLPGLWSVDKRVRENFDIWINVIHQGLAYVYFMSVDDFTGEPVVKRLKFEGGKESLIWLPLVDDDDKKYIDSLKEDAHTANTNQKDSKQTQDWKKEITNIKKWFAIELIILNDIGELDLTQSDIARMIPGEDGEENMSQQWVSHVKKEFEREGLYDEVKSEVKSRV